MANGEVFSAGGFEIYDHVAHAVNVVQSIPGAPVTIITPAAGKRLLVHTLLARSVNAQNTTVSFQLAGITGADGANTFWELYCGTDGTSRNASVDVIGAVNASLTAASTSQAAIVDIVYKEV